MSVEPESGPGDSATSERTSGFHSTGPEVRSDSSDLHLQQPRPGPCDRQPTPEVSHRSRQQEECVPPSLIASHVKFAVVRASFYVNFCCCMSVIIIQCHIYLPYFWERGLKVQYDCTLAAGYRARARYVPS